MNHRTNVWIAVVTGIVGSHLGIAAVAAAPGPDWGRLDSHEGNASRPAVLDP